MSSGNKVIFNTSALNVIKQRPAVESFVPNVGGQVRVTDSKAHEIIVAGGNNSGKSFIGILLCAWHIVPEIDKNGSLTGRTIHPHIELRIPSQGREGWISSHSSDSQRDTLRPIIDKLLRPYFQKVEMEDGVYKRLYFKGIKEDSWINMKWQKQGPRSYAGPKKSFAFLDEPHMKQIYQETRARLFKNAGYMWNCLTPVVDSDSPVRARDILWMRDQVVEPWYKHPENFPLREVIHIDVEENYDHMDGNFVDDMLAGMSVSERSIRKSGLFILFSGRNCFNTDMLKTILTYLEEHEDESTPEYGTLEYSPNETDDKWKVEFVENSRIDFAHKPQGEWTYKFWERHVDGTGLQHCPGYLMSVDVAEGKIGGDYTSAYVFRKDSKRIVAALHGHITEEDLAIRLWLLGHYYNDGYPDYDPAELAIEIRNYGAATQRYLINGSAELGIPRYPWHKIYQRPTSADMDRNIEYGTAPGWDTNARTRKYVITGAREAMVLAYRSIQNNELCKIPDIGALIEAREFVQNKDLKYEGHPDDRVITLGIGHAILGHAGFEYDAAQVRTEEGTPSDELWVMAENPDTGLLQAQFNERSMIDSIVSPKPTGINF